MGVLDVLNKRQRQAVEGGDGPVLIIAGPGTGKTKTLTARIVYLLQSQQIKPENILALTFTAKAAREMSERVTVHLGYKHSLDILTFHALGFRLLQEQADREQAAFIAEVDRLALIKQLARSQAFKGMSARELSLTVSKQKGALHKDDGPVMQLVEAYNEELARRKLRDFDDLLSQTHELLRQNQALQRKLQSRYRYIMIDEFQDTSELQWELVRLLQGTDNVFIIGDPKQSIYSFRGASAEMFDRFRADFPQHTAITLQSNYRSAQRIVALANNIFPDSEPLKAQTSDDGEVLVIETLNEYSEADLVLDTIERGIGGSTMLTAGESQGQHFKDFAVLYRTHHVAKPLQQRLRDSGIPFQVVGEGSPYERPEIRAVLDSLKWLHTHEQLPAIKGYRSPQVQTLLEQIDTTQPISDMVQVIAETFVLAGDDTRKQQQLEQLRSTLVRFDSPEDGLEQCLAYFEDIEQREFYDPEADAVTLLTIHASKGLEFSHVILVAAEEGTLPHIRKTVPTDIEEEQRLFFVAATRAKQRLHILHAKKRGGEDRKVSRFVVSLPEASLPRAVDPDMGKLEKKLHRRQQKARQATLF